MFSGITIVTYPPGIPSVLGYMLIVELPGSMYANVLLFVDISMRVASIRNLDAIGRVICPVVFFSIVIPLRVTKAIPHLVMILQLSSSYDVQFVIHSANMLVMLSPPHGRVP